MKIEINGRPMTGDKVARVGKVWAVGGLTVLGTIGGVINNVCMESASIINEKPKRKRKQS